MGASIHIALDASGKIQQITGTGALLERLSQTIPGQLTSFYEGMIQEDQIQRLVTYKFLPENEVSAADQWESSTSQSMLLGRKPRSTKLHLSRDLAGRSNGTCHQLFEEISPRSTGEDSALPLIMKGGQGKGAILLSRENHILIAYQSIQKLSSSRLGWATRSDAQGRRARFSRDPFHTLAGGGGSCLKPIALNLPGRFKNALPFSRRAPRNGFNQPPVSKPENNCLST